MERTGEYNQDLANIDFKHLTISFDRHDNLSKGLIDLPPSLMLAHGAEIDPVTLNRVYTDTDTRSQVTTINAVIDCLKDSQTFDSDWQSHILYELESYYHSLDAGYTVVTLPGETNSIYVTKNFAKQATLIQTTDYDDGCSIEISPVSSQYIDYALGGDYREPEDRLDQPDSHQLYEIFNAWAKSQQLIFGNHSNQWQDQDYKYIHVSLVDKNSQLEADIETDQTSLEQLTNKLDHQTALNQSSEHLSDQEVVNYYNKLYHELETTGGNFAAKERLLQIGTAFTDPDAAAKFHLNAPSFLLHGQPGNGKTELVEAFARGTESELIYADAIDVQGKAIGESTRLIDHLVQKAIDRPNRVVLFFDEIDTLINDSNHQEYRNAAKHLGKLIELLAKNHPHVLVAACMNAEKYEVIESIIRPGRLEVIAVKPPESYAEIRDIWFSVLYKDNPPLEIEENNITVANSEYSDIDIFELAKNSAGLTGADIAHILASVRGKKLVEYSTSGLRRPVSQHDLLSQIKSYLADRADDDDI